MLQCVSRKGRNLDIELIAKEMRERALLIEGNSALNEDSLKTKSQLLEEKQRKQKALEEFRSLYFNEGRWAAGATDWTARKAFEQVGGKIEAGRER